LVYVNPITFFFVGCMGQDCEDSRLSDSSKRQTPQHAEFLKQFNEMNTRSEVRKNGASGVVLPFTGLTGKTVVVFFMVNGYKKDVRIVDVGMGYYTVSTKFFMTTVKMNTNMSRREVLVHDKDLIKNFWEQKIDSQYQVTESEDVRMKKSALKK
ncbi:UNVERIFIED_CONTAM: hypothetical protein FKN15_036973, partial [Acipenser sinensis]